MKETVNESEKYRKVLSEWRVPPGVSEDTAWERIQAKRERASRPVRTLSPGRWAWAAAAAAIVAVCFVLFRPGGASMEMAATREVRSFQLPDGSEVVLNLSSSLSFKDVGDKREIQLSGEAFFEVVKGEPFTVHTANGAVEVLGTSFNVFARGEDPLIVQCHTGKVRVSSGPNVAVITPGQQATFSGDFWQVVAFDPQQPDWRSGEFRYENAPVDRVLRELARQFGMEIEMPELSGRFFNGSFSTGDLNAALETVCLPMQLEYSVNEAGKTIVVRDAR